MLYHYAAQQSRFQYCNLLMHANNTCIACLFGRNIYIDEYIYIRRIIKLSLYCQRPIKRHHQYSFEMVYNVCI